MKAPTAPAARIHQALCAFHSFSPKQPSTGNNRQIGERQTEGQAHQEAERLDPSRYDDDGQTLATKM